MEIEKKRLKKLYYRIAVENDRSSFNIFFRHYHTRLIRFAILFVHNYDHAEDIVSNVLVRILKNREKVFLMENFESYLFQSVKNESINFLKREKKLATYSIDDEDDFICGEFVDPLEKLITDELRVLVTRTVEGLSPKRRMVYKLIKDEGLKYREVAGLLDISERTVEVHLKFAVKEVREAVVGYLKSSRDGAGEGYLKIAKVVALIALGI